MSDSAEQPRRNGARDKLTRLVQWFDTRLGLSNPVFRPVPQYSINPFYWLGALAVTAFVIQGITGVIMMLYYVPSPTQAYSSTQYIFNSVPYGRFLETVHLYTAYAMIMLSFMHMMRGYFVSVQKKPRELMWVVGMGMGFVTLGFGFTGYLLPWTVVSKSATDVGVGMINALPAGISSFLSFLIVGTGEDSTTLLRFYDLHIILLPAILLVLLAAKMYMLETHGISDPITSVSEKKRKLIPVFPDATVYLLELAALFGAGMLIISLLFPLSLPPQFTPELAATYTPQPDWYFLWIYQIIKISAFETAGLPVALATVTAIFIILVILPFIDRTNKKRFAQRPVYIGLGAAFVAELVALTYWGLVTPGQIISNEQAALVLGGIAIAVVGGTYLLHSLLYRGARSKLITRNPSTTLRSAQAWTCTAFVLLVGLGAMTIGGSLDSAVRIIRGGMTVSNLESFIASILGLGGVVLGTIYLLYRLDLGTGSIKKRIRLFEIGWEHDESL
jgi:quinol-cytochrome oxidoreductase complex cytochrome b subunit